MGIDQKDYWDTAATKKFTTPFQMDVFKSYLPGNPAILDVGCGYGRILEALFQEGFKNSCGIDFSGKMLEKGKQRYPHLDMVLSRTFFPFAENTFDAVILVAVLTCIIETEHQKCLIEEIERVLKPGGILYINDFLINQDQRNVDRYHRFKADGSVYGVFELEDGARLRHHTADHLFWLTEHFEIRAYQHLVYTTMNQHLSNGFYYLGKRKTK